MKSIFIILLTISYLTSCSGGGSSGSNNSDTTTNGWQSYSVESASSLPACSTAILGRLYYLEDSQIFQVCKTAGWQTITLGNTISSNQLISNTTTDFCTQNSGESCFFTGGQIVKYSDGTVMVLGDWLYLYETSNPDYDSDHAMTTISVIYPSNVTYGYQKLSPLVARGSGYKSVYLVFTRSPESIKLILDIDNDGIPESSEETLYTATLGNW